MNGSLLDDVRRACQNVAQQADLVKIDEAVLEEYAARLPLVRMLMPEMDPVIHYLWHGRETVAYFLTLGAINFGSGFFPLITGDPNRSGYRMIAAALTRQFAGYGPVPPEKLRVLSPTECRKILRWKTSSPPADELITLYTKGLNDLGAYVCERFNNDFSAVVEEAGHSAEGLVELLAAMPLLDDQAYYHGSSIPFYKRAQLTPADLFIVFSGQGAGRFDDIDRLTICADNLVPHVLRLDGILHYSEELAERIDRGEPLTAGAPEEIEIRACSLHAGELLVAALRRRGERVNAILLDNYLWHRGQEPLYRARPRHRTLTTFY